jgi:hypothetical protein
LPYPLFSLGCSTLYSVAAADPREMPSNANRVGAAVGGDTFGTVDFGGRLEHRFVTLRVRDATGKTRVEQTLLASQLRH